MAKRRLPSRPDVDHLRREAKALFASYRDGQPAAIQDFQSYHPACPEPATAKLSDAQLVLSRSYRFPSWPRLKTAAELCRAIDDNDVDTLEQVVRDHPSVLKEGTRGLDTCATWGPPLTYALYLGRSEAAACLVRLSGVEQKAAYREAQRHVRTQLSDWFLDRRGRPKSPGVVMNPCEVLNPTGLEYLLEHGAELADEHGDPFGPVAMILQTYSRNPEGRHRCLEICAERGIEFPDTPVMAFHRGRIDLLCWRESRREMKHVFHPSPWMPDDARAYLHYRASQLDVPLSSLHASARGRY